MAGEIEEPFSLSFQGGSIHSGSISFGRFETESLSWERRSSFSHNRYLEEVEKYSRPGSVTEKKAYFEAHFRRKALLSQSSSECQSGIEYQTSENDTSENMGYAEEFEHINEGGPSVQYDQRSNGSEYDGDSEVVDYDREDGITSYVEPLFEPALNGGSVVVHSVSECVNPEDARGTEAESLPIVDDQPGQNIRENSDGETANVDLTCETTHPSFSSRSTIEDDRASLEHCHQSCPEVASKLVSKLMKPQSKSPSNVTRVQRNISSEQHSAKKTVKTEREGQKSTKSEEQSLHTTALTTSSVHRTSKLEGSRTSKSKAVSDARCKKQDKTKRIVEPNPSALAKVVLKAQQSPNRPKQAENSIKSGTKQSLAVFNFKSNERAERRKEFFMKLEEKMHAKEAEMNQIQAKKLEKTEAEIKQFRRSLNFKATPMPSFYHGAVQSGSNKSKAVSSSIKSGKLRSKSTRGCEAAGRSPSDNKAKHNQATSNIEPAIANDPPQAAAEICSSKSVPSETSVTSRTRPTIRGQTSQDEMNSALTVKKENAKQNGKTLQKCQVAGSGKATKEQRVEGKRKIDLGRRNNEVLRKGSKGVTTGGVSRMSHLAVGVAS